MSKSTISTFELFQRFPDQESARLYFEAARWPDGAVCPACGEAKRIGPRKGGFYRCNACLSDFTIRTGTIFERRPNPAWKNGEPAVMRGTLEFDFDERDTEQLTELFKVFGLNFPPST